jgi:hypothetical protein
MKTLFRLLPLLTLLVAFARAADDKIIAAVRAADDERMAAFIAADEKRLQTLFSDELHYAHSSGRVDTKVSQIALLKAGTTRYQKFDHKERVYTVAGPNLVLSRGRVLVHMTPRNGEAFVNDLNYLAVWRNEGGTWRFLAWQSCKNPPADAAKK